MCSQLEFTIICSVAVTSETEKRLLTCVIFKLFSSRRKGGQVEGEAPGRFAAHLNFHFALLHKDTLQLSGSLTWYVHLTGSHSSDLSSNRMRTSLHLQRTGFLSSDISLEQFHIEPGPKGQPPLEV